jgi:hypothetical protein
VPGVGSFSLKPWSLMALLGMLAVIILILVLPQVDLLDTAFQINTSPLAANARVTAGPLVSAPIILIGFFFGMRTCPLYGESEKSKLALGEPAQILNHTLRC